MSERGKYYGQRLRAKEVLRLYAAGERDFRGTVLCGCNFYRAVLSGTDFSGADIRSARFVDAILREVDFSQAKAGLRWWWLGRWFLVVLITGPPGFFLGYIASWLAYFIIISSNLYDSILYIATVGVVVIFLTAITYQGPNLKTLGIFGVTVASTFAFALAFPFIFPGTITSAGGIAVVITATFAFAFSVAIAGAIPTILAIWVALAGGVFFALHRAFTNTVRDISNSEIAAALAIVAIVAIVIASFLIYADRQIYKDDPKFRNLRVVGLAFATLRGTTFSGADLTDALFTQAYLKDTNFANSRKRPTVLDRVRWHYAQKLGYARLGTSILQDLRVRHLLITLSGIGQDFTKRDLSGANLVGAKLHRTIFREANLNGATLQMADLETANFTKATCVGTDFTETHLTGATIEAWNIDDTTILKDIDCQYVFLKESPNHLGVRERLPHNPDKCFEPGDFEKYFREVLDEVKLLIRGGVDPQAFKVAFQELMRKHQITPDDVRGIQRKGADVLMSVAVPSNQSKPDIARTFDTAYERALPESTAQALLEAERRSKQDIIQLANKSIDSISQVLSNLTINNMNNPINTGNSSFINAGTMTGNVVNLGEISGHVSNQINQLPDTVNADQPSLKDLLTQLKQAIDQDTELSQDEKVEALGEVAKLAKAGSNSKEGKMRGLAKRATATLKSIAETLTDTSKLATACKTLLPMITALF